MNYKIKSMLTITILLLLMVAVGVIVNNVDNKITGAATSEKCECSSDAQCNDNNQCTEDYCLYPENCKASLCLHKPIPDCG